MIKLENINKTYHNGSPLHVLKGINLEVAKGELVSIMGASGSGKSTLLNIMAGLEKPTKGEVWITGKEVTGMSENELAVFRRQNVGFIFQSYNLMP